MYIIGRTGVGKTTIERTLAVHDILQGNGIGVVDPHGEFVEDLLKMIPKERINDVVYFNPADNEFPLAFNAMEYVSSEMRHTVAAGLMSVFKKIWPDVWSPRMEYILNNCLLALLEYPDSTLLGISHLLANKDFRKDVVDHLTDPVVRAFWTDEFARYHDRFQVEAIAPIQNKVGQFVSNPLIRNIIGQPKSKINLREIIDQKKILLVRLPTGLIGESNSSLLGGLLITKLQQAAMSRIDVPESKRQDFFLLIDEFQSFATEAFVNILAEARKYRLNLTIAHQYIEQIEETIRAAILGTIGTLVTFRIGARDAYALEKEFEPMLTAQDLVNLPKYQFYIKLLVDGVTSQPFLASTLPPSPIPEKTYEEEIIALSRLKYCSLRKDVEEMIAAQFEKRGGEINKEVQKENTALYDAQCASCKKDIKVPFQPDPKRPVYCKNCLKKAQRERALKEMYEKEKKQKKQETSHEGLTSLLKEIVHKPEDSSGQDTSQNPEKL